MMKVIRGGAICYFVNAPKMAHEFECIRTVRNFCLEEKKMKPLLYLEFQNIRMRQVLKPYSKNSLHLFWDGK